MITLYSKNHCPNCLKAKTLLKDYGLEYTEVKIDEDADARQFLLKKGHRAVPQMYVKDHYFADYEDLAMMTEFEAEAKVEELEN